MLRSAHQQGLREALQKFGLAQPSLNSVGITSPVKAPGLPAPTKSVPMNTSDSTPGPSLGLRAAKVAANPTPGVPSPTKPSTPNVTIPSPLDPATLAQTFNMHEQGRTRLEPQKKVADELPTRLCTTCRKARHYGPCPKTPRVSLRKHSSFNVAMTGADPTYVAGTQDNPATSPHYHSAVSASAQAATGFADLFRHLGITSLADQPNHMKRAVAEVPGSVAGVVGNSEEGALRINRMFDSFDQAANSSVVDGADTPATGPAALG